MKNVRFLFFVVLVGLQNVLAQKGEPCATPNQNRTLQEVGEILMKDGVYYDSLRKAYAEAVNYNIGRGIITSDKKGMLMLLRGSKLMDQSFIVPSEFYNGVRYGDKVIFTTLLGSPSNYWLVFESEGVDYPYGRVVCMNPQKKRVKYITLPKNEEKPTEQKKAQIEQEQRARSAYANRNTYVENNYYANNDYQQKENVPQQQEYCCEGNNVNIGFDYSGGNREYHSPQNYNHYSPSVRTSRPARINLPHASGGGGRPSYNASGSGSFGRGNSSSGRSSGSSGRR